MENKSKKIKFNSFIALNRYLDRALFQDTKLLALIIYIALKVNRKESSLVGYDNIELKEGEFMIGRNRTSIETELSEQEYRTRFNKLHKMRIVKTVRTTSKHTIGKWLGNEVIDLNLASLERPINQQNNQQLTTNNNTNNQLVTYITNNLVTSNTYTPKQYIEVIEAYKKYKGVDVRGEEIKDLLWPIEKMFKSSRSVKQIKDFMHWLQGAKNNSQLAWTRNWTINTVQKKLPEHLAGKLVPEDPLGHYEEIDLNEDDY